MSYISLSSLATCRSFCENRSQMSTCIQIQLLHVLLTVNIQNVYDFLIPIILIDYIKDCEVTSYVKFLPIFTFLLSFPNFFPGFVLWHFLYFNCDIKGTQDKYNIFLFMSNYIEDFEISTWFCQCIFILWGILWTASPLECPIGYCIVYLLKSTLENRKC